MADLVIGLGTGRCGTNSLTQLLNQQHDLMVFHELRFLPWKPNYKMLPAILVQLLTGSMENELSMPYDLYDRIMAEMNIQDVRLAYTFRDGKIGDVGFYWINYVESLLELFPRTKFVCLKRDKIPTVNSWFKQVSIASNYWTKLDSDYWDIRTLDCKYIPYFPQYDAPKKEAIGQYWEEYYTKAEDLEKKLPDNFKIFRNFTIFEEEEKQQELLSWLNIPENEQIINLDIKKNFLRTFKPIN